MSQEILSQLVALSNRLGQPELECAILGEGNTSARADAGSFYVKASGYNLQTIPAAGFVQVAFERILKLLDASDISDQAVKEGLTGAKVDPTFLAHPSVETLLHACCLSLPGINFVGHTHPIAINSLTCSVGFEKALSGRLFPDEIVVLGPEPLLVPYTDPGVPLARKINELVLRYLDRWGEAPKVIYMQNHGVIALGKNPTQVENITLMAVKTARILLGTYAAGGPRYLKQVDVDRIHTRPDELVRKLQLKLQ